MTLRFPHCCYAVVVGEGQAWEAAFHVGCLYSRIHCREEKGVWEGGREGGRKGGRDGGRERRSMCIFSVSAH